MVELSVEVLLGVAAISFGINWVAFVIAYALQTEKFYDIVGSATYVSCIWFSIAYAGIWNARQLVVSVMVTIWTVRLGVFLFVRVLKTGGDSRFEAMLKQPLNYFIAWTLQGVWVFVNLLGVVLLNATRKNPDFNAADIIGGGLWLLGFLCEAVADQQKFNFKMNPENRGKFISTGLWRWSRYPNYFGEMCIWWGVFIFVAPSLRDWEFVAVAGPLFTMFLLLAVSGIPLQEKQRNDRWGTDPEYQEYLKQSNLLIPLPITTCCGSSKTASEASNEASLSPGRA